MDRNKGVKAGANSSDISLFSLWFNSINFDLLGIGIINKVKKVENPNTNVVDVYKPNKGIADLEEKNRTKLDKVDRKGVEESGTGTVNPMETDKVKINKAKANVTDKPDIKLVNPVDPTKTDKVDKQKTSIVNLTN